MHRRIQRIHLTVHYLVGFASIVPFKAERFEWIDELDQRWETRAIDHLGLDSRAAKGVEPEVAKLADGVSQDWVARFRAEQEGA